MKAGPRLRLFRFYRSLRGQILSGVFGVFFILVLSAGYILYSAKRLQTVSDNVFEQDRFIKALQDDLTAYQAHLLEYLSTRSSNALARILVDGQSLRGKLPSYTAVTDGAVSLKERELYTLIYSYLNLADQSVEEKRGRNITAYTRIYDEMERLLSYINAEIEAISTERFHGQLDAYGLFIAKSGEVHAWNLFFIIFTSLFATLLLLKSVGRFTDPLVRLFSMAAELSGGNFDIGDIETGSVREIDQVIEAFNRMKNEIRHFIEEMRRQENIKQEYMREKMRNMKMEGLVRHMEIYALQAQMNPHFLFNTLNTGMQLAILEGADKTSEYMDIMAQFFRHIIRNKEIIVPLRHEIEGLRYYFEILKVRFSKNLDLLLDYDETLQDACRVPVSIIQPLVENCIVHAFKEMPPMALIIVRAEKQEDRLVLSVRDNGCGISHNTVEKLLHPLSLDESSQSRVMGLENVIQRLYFFYPDDPDLIRIETVLGEGTAVIIRIDTRREPCIGS
ncbi:MAG: histidine kinase [Treponema sp.]|jgi:signal transduction histidine kinase|nr:histidine kinase [Treponema sp.]